MLDAMLRNTVDLALPPRCPGCGAPVGINGRFCVDCWGELRFLGPPWCAGCHLPFDFDAGAAAWCGDCAARRPRHTGVDAAVAYGPIARRLALKLKYGGRIGLADTVAALMRRHLSADAALIVPVPLHRWRLWSRGYNQAALIARALARHSGVPHTNDALVRTRRTPVLRGLSGYQRSRAVRAAFAVTPAGRAAIAGQRIVLVDDIYTSGATANACAAALLDAGAAEVRILCWARVLTGDD